MSEKILRGVVHGNTITLQDNAGIQAGETVEIIVRRLPPVSGRSPGDGLQRTEGALADDPHWDAIMSDVQAARKLERRDGCDAA